MAGFFEPVFQQLNASGQQIPAAVGAWVKTFVQQGVPAIATRLAACDPCDHEGCATKMFAGTRCLKCRRTVCVGHAFLLANGKGFCFACTELNLTDGRQITSDDATVIAAFATLQLAPSATALEVKKRAKTLLAKHHPDKAAPRDQAAAVAQFRLIQQATDAILKARGWS